MKKKQWICAGVLLLALLTLCVPAYHRTVRASDMEARTEVYLHVDEEEQAEVSESDDRNTDSAGVRTGDSENILFWSLTAGTVLLAGAVFVIRKKQQE